MYQLMCDTWTPSQNRDGKTAQSEVFGDLAVYKWERKTNQIWAIVLWRIIRSRQCCTYTYNKNDCFTPHSNHK